MSRLSLAIAFAITACQYKSPNTIGDDDVPIDTPLPDPGCTVVGKGCVSDLFDGSNQALQTCAAIGEPITEEPCPWGCIDGDDPHCGTLQPSGGALTAADLKPQADDAMLLPIIISADTDFDTNTGKIEGVRIAGPGVISGIGFESRAGVGIFRFRSLQVDELIDVSNTNALAIVALDSLTVNAEIDLVRCGNTPAPGGFAGGGPNQAGGGPDNAGGKPGTGVNDNSSAGGGGAHAGNGGIGGAGAASVSPAGGVAFGTAEILVLIGGAGGGGGGNTGGAGGNGGGAIQLVSNGPIVFTSEARLNAGGCGGQSGQDKKAAGGGGAGGTVLVEALTIQLGLEAVIAVNGGGGGGGDRVDEGATNGQNAKFSRSPALGGTAGDNGGVGGSGASGEVFVGSSGSDDLNGGGGGGGIGWIRLNTRTGEVTVDPEAVVSPSLVQTSPASIGTADVE